MLLKTVLTTTY